MNTPRLDTTSQELARLTGEPKLSESDQVGTMPLVERRRRGWNKMGGAHLASAVASQETLQVQDRLSFPNLLLFDLLESNLLRPRGSSRIGRGSRIGPRVARAMARRRGLMHHAAKHYRCLHPKQRKAANDGGELFHYFFFLAAAASHFFTYFAWFLLNSFKQDLQQSFISRPSCTNT